MTIIGGGPETINLPETQFVCKLVSGEAAKWRPFWDSFVSEPAAQVNRLWPSKRC